VIIFQIFNRLIDTNKEAVISVSIGITIAPIDGGSVQISLKNSDTVMYQAKSAGRNPFQFFTPSMNERVRQRMYIEQALRHANKIENLYYISLKLFGVGVESQRHDDYL
jgi:predicted signal transduction protein with EAL and GGDEF domain